MDTHSINSIDAIVLCSALDIATRLRNEKNELVLVASDQRLLRAAQTQGPFVFNPENDSQQVLENWGRYLLKSTEDFSVEFRLEL